jgi:uncharacterized protein (TIGR02453 family)
MTGPPGAPEPPRPSSPTTSPTSPSTAATHRGAASPVGGVGGIPEDAVAFYAELESNNTRDWWAANKVRYTTSVRDPFTRLIEAVAPEFGTPRIFRPQRDTRFSPDKSPYKTHQGAILEVAEGLGYWIQLGADGLVTGGGFHHSAADQVARYRAAVDDDATGNALVGVVDGLRRSGFEIGGDSVRTRPRGVPADHPRLELMRHQSLVAWQAHGVPEWLPTQEVVERVRASWAQIRPLCDWLADRVGSTSDDSMRTRRAGGRR